MYPPRQLEEPASSDIDNHRPDVTGDRSHPSWARDFGAVAAAAVLFCGASLAINEATGFDKVLGNIGYHATPHNPNQRAK